MENKSCFYGKQDAKVMINAYVMYAVCLFSDLRSTQDAKSTEQVEHLTEIVKSSESNIVINKTKLNKTMENNEQLKRTLMKFYLRILSLACACFII